MSESPTSASTSASAVAHLLDGVTDLPSIPAVALEIVRLTEDESCTLDQFSTALSRDPALASKVLRFANSSLYSLSTPASNLQSATMILGTRAVKLMSLSFSLAGSLPSNSSGVFDVRQYWRRSLLCAVAARSIAEHARSRLTEEAFLCGLLSRIGQLVLGHCRPDLYSQLGNAPGRSWPLPTEERRVLGFDSYEIGSALLRRWSLPSFLCDAVEFVTDPAALPSDAGPETVQLTKILHSAMRCDEFISGESGEPSPAELAAELRDVHQMDDEQVNTFLEGLGPSLNETAQMLDVEVDAEHSGAIIAEAQRLLLNESLGIANEAEQAREHATQLEIRNRQLDDQAHSDALTGLCNRAGFDLALEQSLANSAADDQGQSVGLLMIDVDRFKRFNDQYGHQAGDEVLRLIGRTIRDGVRENEVAARYGGEEFAVILPRASAVGLAAVAERIRGAIELSRLEVDGEQLSVTASMGGALATETSGSNVVTDSTLR